MNLELDERVESSIGVPLPMTKIFDVEIHCNSMPPGRGATQYPKVTRPPGVVTMGPQASGSKPIDLTQSLQT